MSFFYGSLSDISEYARSLQQAIAPTARDGNSGHSRDYRRQLWLAHYRYADRPRVPMSTNVTANTALLLYMFGSAFKVQAQAGLPTGTKLLLAANFLPFLKPAGFSLPKYGLSSFMVKEHRQWYRLITAGLLHVDLDHAVSNTVSLLISASYLERSLPRPQFAALTASLGLTSQTLYVLLTWSDFRWFAIWRSYFQEAAVGASGVCFALQVVADDMRGGRVSVMGISGLDMPAKFSCWASLAITQLIVPQASFTGHLCGIIAGLAHIYLPKAVRELKWRIQGEHEARHASARQAAADMSHQEEQLHFTCRRWPDLAVHAACLCAALLARTMLEKQRCKT